MSNGVDIFIPKECGFLVAIFWCLLSKDEQCENVIRKIFSDSEKLEKIGEELKKINDFTYHIMNGVMKIRTEKGFEERGVSFGESK